MGWVKMLTVVSLLLLPCAFTAAAVSWTEFPALSSTQNNLYSLTPSSLVPFLKESPVSVIWFHPENISSADKLSYFLLRQSFLSPAADRLDVPFAEFPITNSSEMVVRTLGVNESDIDTIHVYSNLRRVVYYGLRTSDALVSFVKKLQCPKFTVIEGKADKKQFDLVDKVRVLAFLVPGTSFARSYANASLAFGPRIKFFVILDESVARRYSLTEGDVQVHRPGERSFVELAAPASASDIIAFVREEGGKAFFQTHRLNTENIYSFWREASNQLKFVLLTTSSHNSHSAHFHKLLRRSIKNDTQCQIYVIDVDQFPRMADYWSKNFGVDPSAKPALGYVSLQNGTALWLNQKSINSSEGRESEERNKLAISDFVNSILNGTTKFESSNRRANPFTGRTSTTAGSKGFLKDDDVVDVAKLLKDGGNAEYQQPDTKRTKRQQEEDLDAYASQFDRREDTVFSSEKKPEPYFVLEDETVHYDTPKEKLGLTSFGSHSPLNAPFSSAQTKRRTEF